MYVGVLVILCMLVGPKENLDLSTYIILKLDSSTSVSPCTSKSFTTKTPLKFWGVDCIHPNWRGSNLVREISEGNAKQIFLMHTLAPKAINVELACADCSTWEHQWGAKRDYITFNFYQLNENRGGVIRVVVH